MGTGALLELWHFSENALAFPWSLKIAQLLVCAAHCYQCLWYMHLNGLETNLEIFPCVTRDRFGTL
jgi:hypothetical protein